MANTNIIMTEKDIDSMIVKIDRITKKLILSKSYEEFKSRQSITITVDSISDQIRYFHDKFKSNVKKNCIGTIYRSASVSNINLFDLPTNNKQIHCEHTFPIKNIRETLYQLFKENPSHFEIGRFLFLTHMPTCIHIWEKSKIKKGMHFENKCFEKLLTSQELNNNNFKKIPLFNRYSDDLEIIRIPDNLKIDKETYTIGDHIIFIEQHMQECLKEFGKKLEFEAK